MQLKSTMAYYKNARWSRWSRDMALMRDFSSRMELPRRDGTFFLSRDGNEGVHIEVDGQQVLNFSSYDYLGLAQHPSVISAAHAALDRYGASASASRMVCGQTAVHEALDNRIAEFLGTEDAITFNSGFGTNASTIGFLFTPQDLVIHDHYMHQSALEGIRLSGATRLSFPHNDVAALAELLRANEGTFRKALVLVEGAYSMDGDVCPLREIVQLKRSHDFILMVDEAHSLGTVGQTGRGIAEHAGVARGDVDIWMGTLSKTLASCGGYLAGDAELIEYLRYQCPGFVFSAALPPVGAAAADAALQVLQAEPALARTLQQNVAQAQSIARREGLDIGTADHAPILPVILGDLEPTLHASFTLFKRGICAHPLVYPAVARGQARLRFFITAAHTEDQLRRGLEAVNEALDRVAG